MMHLFGVMHTQMRADRDKYITVYKNNIIPYFKHEYDVGTAILQSCFRSAGSATTMGCPMTALPSCTMGQRLSPQGTGP